MKVIITGSRHIQYPCMNAVIVSSGLEITEVISGGCPTGVDREGEIWARTHFVPIKRFLAFWELHGKSAGPIRNKNMAEYADALILIWDGKSRGSANMKLEMLKLGKPTFEVMYDGWNSVINRHYMGV